jgi:hypothetical protein
MARIRWGQLGAAAVAMYFWFFAAPPTQWLFGILSNAICLALVLIEARVERDTE